MTLACQGTGVITSFLVQLVSIFSILKTLTLLVHTGLCWCFLNPHRLI